MATEIAVGHIGDFLNERSDFLDSTTTVGAYNQIGYKINVMHNHY